MTERTNEELAMLEEGLPEHEIQGCALYGLLRPSNIKSPPWSEMDARTRAQYCDISRRLREQGEPKQVGFIYYKAAATGGSGHYPGPRFYTNPSVVIPSCDKGPFPVYTLDGEQGERIEGWVIDERVHARGQGRTIEFKTGPVRSWPDAAPATLILHPKEPDDGVV